MSDKIILERQTSSDAEISESLAVEDVSDEYSDDYEEEVEDEEESEQSDDEKEEKTENMRTTPSIKKHNQQTRPAVKKTIVNEKLARNAKRSRTVPKKLTSRQERPRSMLSNSSIHSSYSSKASIRLSNTPGRSISSRSDSRLQSRASSSAQGSDQLSFVQERVRSARRKASNALRNDIGHLHIMVKELSTENKTLRRLAARQERELNRFSGADGELPVILKAHNEETRVLRLKMKQAQEANKELATKLKEKDIQLFKMRETNRELKKLSKNRKLEERSQLQSELSEVKSHLQHRDSDFKDLMHKHDILEKSHKQQMTNQLAKHKETRKKLKEANNKIESLESIIKEKNKTIHRLHIYSNHFHGSSMKTSASTGNIANDTEHLDDDFNSFKTKVNNKLQGTSFEVLNETKEDVDDKSGDEQEEDEILEENEDTKETENISTNPDKNKEEIQECGGVQPSEDDYSQEEIKHSAESPEPESYSNTFTIESEVEEDTKPPESIKSKRDFFENLGPIKAKDLTKKREDNLFCPAAGGSCPPAGGSGPPLHHPISPSEKVNLWLPNPPNEGSPIPSSGRSSHSNTSARSKDSTPRSDTIIQDVRAKLSRGPSIGKLDPNKKAQLLAQMDAIDGDGEPGSYLPSFGPPTPQEKRNLVANPSVAAKILEYDATFGPSSTDGGTLSSDRSLNSSAASSTFKELKEKPGAPTAAPREKKKANLMAELFGREEPPLRDPRREEPPLRDPNSRSAGHKNSAGTVKSVKFKMGEVESVKYSDSINSSIGFPGELQAL